MGQPIEIYGAAKGDLWGSSGRGGWRSIGRPMEIYGAANGHCGALKPHPIAPPITPPPDPPLSPTGSAISRTDPPPIGWQLQMELWGRRGRSASGGAPKSSSAVGSHGGARRTATSVPHGRCGARARTPSRAMGQEWGGGGEGQQLPHIATHSTIASPAP